MTEVFIVEAFRQYGDGWITDVFDSRSKAKSYIADRTANLDPEDDLMFMITTREVK